MKSLTIGSHQGTFNVREELDQYETFWHENVILPSCQELTEKVSRNMPYMCVLVTIVKLFYVYLQFADS